MTFVKFCDVETRSEVRVHVYSQNRGIIYGLHIHTRINTRVRQYANLLELSMIVDVERPDVGQVDASVAIADSVFNGSSTFES